MKLLRRCLTQMSTRTRSFIETCVKFEKEARQQVRPAAPFLSQCNFAGIEGASLTF